MGGRKVTGSLRNELEDFWGRSTAKKIFHIKGTVSLAHFNSVWWLGYERDIFGYPKTFCTFITKQVSGWCGCNSKLSLWEETVINKCPQCRCKNETWKHLTRFTHLGCLLQLHDSIETIMDVMNNTNVTSELADMIETYLLNQGRGTMAECTKPTSTYLLLAISIDKLGWDCFVEGRIPISLINVIKPMFHCYKPHGSIKIWGTKFIKGLIRLTHSNGCTETTTYTMLVRGLHWGSTRNSQPRSKYLWRQSTVPSLAVTDITCQQILTNSGAGLH